MNTVLLVTGGREFAHEQCVHDVLGQLHNFYPDLFVVEGGARGADQWARTFRQRYGVPGQTYPAAWEQHGRAAGTIRNALMLAQAKPAIAVAFPGGPGTRHMLGLLYQHCVNTLIVNRVGDRFASHWENWNAS